MVPMPGRQRLLLLSPLAERDLEEIWTYTRQTWSLGQADRYHGQLLAAMEELAAGVKVAVNASAIREGYWRYSTGRHVIFLRYREDTLIVMRVLHQSMDLPTHLGRNDTA